MPLFTWRMRSMPSVIGSCFGVLAGPFEGCHTNVRGILCALLHAGTRAILDRRRLHAPLARDLLVRRELLEAVHRGPHHVVRVRRADALREDVRDARALEECAHGA